jgi:Spy/CpxP family protein refolding chaperone
MAALGLAAAPLAAQQEGGGGGPPMMMADSTAFEGLGLSAEQKTKIKGIRNQMREQNAPLRQQLMQLTGGKMPRDMTQAQRDSLRPKIEPIRHQMMENARKAHEQIDALLTPDQRAKLKEHMHQRRQAHQRGDSTRE